MPVKITEANPDWSKVDSRRIARVVLAGAYNSAAKVTNEDREYATSTVDTQRAKRAMEAQITDGLSGPAKDADLFDDGGWIEPDIAGLQLLSEADVHTIEHKAA